RARGDDAQLLPDQRGQQGRFPDVRPADESHVAGALPGLARGLLVLAAHASKLEGEAKLRQATPGFAGARQCRQLAVRRWKYPSWEKGLGRKREEDVGRRRRTLPPGGPGSTIRAAGLNGRVRDGNGCVPRAMAADQHSPLRAPEDERRIQGKEVWRKASRSLLPRVRQHETAVKCRAFAAMMEREGGEPSHTGD